MDKKDSKKLAKIGIKSKKIKDQLTFKRKMKQMLSCDSVDKMMMDETEIMDTDYMNDQACDFGNFEPSNGENTDDGNKNKKIKHKIKKKKVHAVGKDLFNKNIKAKVTLKEENEMLNIISGIILSKSEKKKKPIEPPNNSTDKKSNTVDSVFDPNKSLAQKIFEKIKLKEPTNKPSQAMSPVIVKRASGFPMKKNVLIEMDELIRPKRKLSKKLDYKYSVLEVFNNCKANAKAEIFSILPQEPVGPSNGKKSLSSKVSVEDTVKSSDKINTTLDSLTDITDMTDESFAKVETPKPKLPLKRKVNSCSLFVLADCCVVILKRTTKLYFCGKLKASLIYGSAEVLGHKLTDVPQEIYSLPNYSLLCFESCDGVITAPRVSQLTNVGVPISKTQEILEATSEGDSIIMLQPHSSPMTDFMSKHFSYDYNTDLFKRARLDENMHNPEAFKLLQCHFSIESRKGLYAKHFLSENISDVILKGKKITRK